MGVLNDEDWQKHEEDGDDYDYIDDDGGGGDNDYGDDDGDLDFDDRHRDPTRLETNLILVTIAPFHRGNPFPGD